MKIELIPVIFHVNRPRFDYEVVGPERLAVTDLSGEEPKDLGTVDFAPLGEGEMLPFGGIDGQWFRRAMRDNTGLSVQLLLPLSPDHPESLQARTMLTVVSGRVPLPTDGVSDGD